MVDISWFNEYNRFDPNSNLRRKPLNLSNFFDDFVFEKLLNNGLESQGTKNHVPLAYLSIPQVGFRFLISEIETAEPSLVFGLCDFDTTMFFGKFDISKLSAFASEKDLILRNDKFFPPKYALGVYGKVAATSGILNAAKVGTYAPLFDAFDTFQFNNPNLNLSELNTSLGWDKNVTAPIATRFGPSKHNP